MWSRSRHLSTIQHLWFVHPLGHGVNYDFGKPWWIKLPYRSCRRPLWWSRSVLFDRAGHHVIVGYHGLHLSDVNNYYSSFSYGVARSVTFTRSRSSCGEHSYDPWTSKPDGGPLVYGTQYSHGVAYCFSFSGRGV